MSTEELRKQNVAEAKRIFGEMATIIESGSVPWVWQKKRRDRTKLVIAFMSFFRLLREEHVFFNPVYLKDAVDIWKELAESEPEDLGVSKWIMMYEERLREKENISGIGERVVDLSSSPYSLPFCLSMALEYEPVPDWGEIMRDFRKLLNVLAPVKVGIFHLPTWPSTCRVWIQDRESGNIRWESKVLDGDKLSELIEDIKAEIKLNEIEHPHCIYLTMFVRADDLKKEVNLYGYLFWRESNGEVKSDMLGPRKFSNVV